MDVINKETIVKETKEEQEDSRSTDSKESKDSLNGKRENKWTEFCKRKTNKKAPKLLHSLSFPSQSNTLWVSSPSNPDVTCSEKFEKQESDRFHGDGVNFKAKLIGIKEVNQPRGDRLAQDALHELKASVKATNSHKQKILINVSLDGIKIKDDKGNILYHHPVHKISFIAQDITDPRAFGYVFGSPSLGHKFFAIKTEKAAQQLVIAMRDLFHVVFELRKKELENRTNSLNGECQALTDDEKEMAAIITATENVAIISSCEMEETKTNTSNTENNKSLTLSLDNVDSPSINNNLLDVDVNVETSGKHKTSTFDDDFLSSSVSEKNNDPFFADPLNFINSISPSLFSNTTDSFQTNTVAENDINPFSTDSFVISNNLQLMSGDTVQKQIDFPIGKQTEASLQDKNLSIVSSVDKYAPLVNLSVKEMKSDSFDTPPNVHLNCTLESPKSEIESPVENVSLSPSKTSSDDFFSDLDPLGKDRPFVDKKHFFHDVKNPPKKVLKDLVSQTSISTSDESLQPSGSPCAPQFPVNFNAGCPSLVPTVNLSLNETKAESQPTATTLKQPESNKSNPFDDPFFSEDFHFSSPPSNPPPPPPPLTQQFPHVIESPTPPPRPPIAIPPPLPPKRQFSSTAPLIKFVPPVESKHETIDDDEDEANNINNNQVTTSKSAGTLPIPIPLRKSVGNTSTSLSFNSSRSNGSLGIPSVSPSSISMSSVNGTSFGSNSPSCPPNSLNDVLYSSSDLPSFNSSKSESEIKNPNPWVENTLRQQSPPINIHPNPTMSSLINTKSDSFSNGFSNQLNAKVVIFSSNDNNNNYSDNTCDDFMNNEHRSDRTKQWNTHQINSIFRRETDPFADEFFTSLSTLKGKNSLNSVFEVKHKAKQVPRLTNPFVSE